MPFTKTIALRGEGAKLGSSFKGRGHHYEGTMEEEQTEVGPYLTASSVCIHREFTGLIRFARLFRIPVTESWGKLAKVQPIFASK